MPAPSSPDQKSGYVNEPIPEVWQFKLKLVESLLSPSYSKIHIAPSKRPFWLIIYVFIKSRDDWEYSVNHIPCFSAPSSFWAFWAASEWCNQESNGLCEDQFSPPRRSKNAIFWRTASQNTDPANYSPPTQLSCPHHNAFIWSLAPEFSRNSWKNFKANSTHKWIGAAWPDLLNKWVP